MVDKKRLQGKKAKLVRLKEKFEKSQKKLKEAEEEGENRADVLISDLRKDEKLKKEVHKTLADFGLVSDFDQTISDSYVSSDSSDILKFVEPLKNSKKHKKKKYTSSPSVSSPDSSDDSDSSSKHKSYKKKHSKKIKKKVRHVQKNIR